MRVVILGRRRPCTIPPAACSTDGTKWWVLSRHELPAITTRTEADFETLARQHHLPFLCTQTLASQAAQVLLQRLNADVAVSVNWVSVIDQATFSYFKHGIINAHLGDLPQYRGNAVPNWALLNHEEGNPDPALDGSRRTGLRRHSGQGRFAADDRHDHCRH
ncbi:MAG: formyltransferase family protein [Vampirovibrionales bacterium]